MGAISSACGILYEICLLKFVGSMPVSIQSLQSLKLVLKYRS